VAAVEDGAFTLNPLRLLSTPIPLDAGKLLSSSSCSSSFASSQHGGGRLTAGIDEASGFLLPFSSSYFPSVSPFFSLGSSETIAPSSPQLAAS